MSANQQPGSKKRGRPIFSNQSERRSETMTICLSKKTKKSLVKKAKLNQPPLATATMASFIIESELDKKVD